MPERTIRDKSSPWKMSCEYLTYIKWEMVFIKGIYDLCKKLSDIWQRQLADESDWWQFTLSEAVTFHQKNTDNQHHHHLSEHSSRQSDNESSMLQCYLQSVSRRTVLQYGSFCISSLTSWGILRPCIRQNWNEYVHMDTWVQTERQEEKCRCQRESEWVEFNVPLNT